MSRERRLGTDTVRRLTVCTDPWLSCDDCFDGIDSVVEGLLGRGESMDAAFRAHLLGCPVCREEAEALATLVATDHGLLPAAALRILDEQVEDPLPGGARP